MISFGDLKNNLEQLKRYLSKIKIFEQSSLTPKDIEELSLRKNNPHLFLRIINYTLIQYSPSLYKQILQIAPDINTTNDRRFIETVFSISRKLLQYNPPLTPDQFCTNKFFQVKVEMVSLIVKAVYQLDSTKTKNNKIQKTEKYHINHFDDQEQQQQPKSINLAPKPFDKQSINFQIRKNTQLKNNKQFNKEINRQVKPNYFPTNIQPQMQQPQQQSNEDNTIQQGYQSDKLCDYVKRKQLDETLKVLLTVNQTVNNLVEKFNNFQSSVIGWVNNINAKVSILEENIKIIKNNL